MRWVPLLFALLWAAPAHAQPLGALSWLVGCWRMIDARGEITEIWQAPPMPAMLGYSMTRQNGETTSWTQSRIEAMDENLYLVTVQDGRRTARYAWVELRVPNDPAAPRRIVFEHDLPRFPQRVAYERLGDALTLTLSSPRGGQEVFEFRAVSCEGAQLP